MRRLLLSSCIAFGLAYATAAGAQPRPSNEPVLLNADHLTYDQNTGIVTAEGNVEISQGERVLMADRVIYSERDGRVVASGNVSILEPTGEVLFADYAELRDEMRNGVIDNFRARLTDNSRFAAAAATRVDGNTTIIESAVYSPCSLCGRPPEEAPLWQLRAKEVVHDQTAQTITYYNSTLEFFGVPVFWTPYLSHPDPTVERKSGFLVPTFTSNNFFGFGTAVPYYWVIDDQTDMTVTPLLSLEQRPQLGAEFRQRTATGAYRIEGSITNADNEDPRLGAYGEDLWRGHLRADGRFRVGEDFAYGFNVFRASDYSYLRQYRVPGRSLSSLVSRAYVEGVEKSHYLGFNAYSFQRQRAISPQGSSPFVFPLIDYQFKTDPTDQLGSYFSFNSNFAALFRERGTDTRRLALDGSWTLPYTSRYGEVYEFTAGLQSVGYWFNQSPTGELPQNADDNDTALRMRPYAILTWRMPFVSGEGNIRQVLEPIVQGIATPYGGNNRKAPNEDSLTLEFDDTNLFSLNRFPGYDRFDGGPRLNYGLRYGLYGQGGGYSDFFVGQSLRSRDDESYPRGSGVRNNRSDIVTRLTIAPQKWFNFTGRMRLQEGDWRAASSDFRANASWGFLSVGAGYGFISGSTYEQNQRDYELLTLSTSVAVTEEFSVTATHQRDLARNGGSLLNGLILSYYGCDCFGLDLFATRSFTEIENDLTIGFRIRLANLSFGSGGPEENTQ